MEPQRGHAAVPLAPWLARRLCTAALAAPGAGAKGFPEPALVAVPGWLMVSNTCRGAAIRAEISPSDDVRQAGAMLCQARVHARHGLRAGWRAIHRRSPVAASYHWQCLGQSFYNYDEPQPASCQPHRKQLFRRFGTASCGGCRRRRHSSRCACSLQRERQGGGRQAGWLANTLWPVDLLWTW